MIWSVLITEETAFDLPCFAGALLARGMSCHPFLWHESDGKWDQVERRFYWWVAFNADAADAAHIGLLKLYAACDRIFGAS